MTGPNYVYDMLDMEETDYKEEFNNAWRLWRECKKDRDELLAIVELFCATPSHSRWVPGLGTINECPHCHQASRGHNEVNHGDSCPVSLGQKFIAAIAKARGE